MFSLRDLRTYLSVFFAFGISVFFIVQSNAYVLTGPHILELMTTKMGSPAGLYVEQKNIGKHKSQHEPIQKPGVTRKEKKYSLL